MDTKNFDDSSQELENNLETTKKTDLTSEATNQNQEDQAKPEVKESAADIILRKIEENKLKKSQKTNLKADEIQEHIDTEKGNSTESKDEPDKVEEKKESQIDISNFSLEKMTTTLKSILEEQSIENLKDIVENIKIKFYKKLNTQNQEMKDKFIQNGGDEAEFKPEENTVEQEFKLLLQNYKELKTKHNKQIEEQKLTNLKQKQQIIEEIKNLINRQEAFNDTFHEFRELQKKWFEIGLVPQNEIKKLWESYHYHIENFYDYIKINKELRDLDLKKNMEAKITLCENAEELLLEPMITKAFKTLQKYHEQWSEIGPVPREQKEELWLRFKEATSKINKKHQEYFQDLKKEQDNNLKAKELLSQKAEELSEDPYESHKNWDDASKELIELQKIWRLIGFAPKKDNNKIYARFRNACDIFFERKREFYAKSKGEQDENLQLKQNLCEKAESLQESTDWSKTTELLIKIQKDWKNIGPVPRKHSDEVWNRFRAACNKYFDRKSDHFANIGQEYDENLVKKKDLVERIKAFTASENMNENVETLKAFQKDWITIGHVPIKEKDAIQTEYREAINIQFDSIKLDESKRFELKFKSKIESIASGSRPENKLRNERDKVKARLDKLNNDINVWENNIGFFSKSKNAESMIQDFNKKITKAKKDAQSLNKQLRMIDAIEY